MLFRLFVFFVLAAMFVPSMAMGHSVIDTVNDVVHSHNYTDLDPDDPANVNVNEWHEHKDARQDDGSIIYTEISHHGSAQRDSGHDGIVDNPEPEEYPVNPNDTQRAENEVVDPIVKDETVQPSTPTISTPVVTIPSNTSSKPVTVIPVPTKDVVVPEEVVVEEVIVEEIVELVRFEYGYWYQGLNFVSFPVLPEGVETVKDLFDRYQLFQSFQLVSQDPFEYTGDAIYVVIDGSWLSYGGEEDNPIGDIVITPYMGFVLLMDYSIWLGITGNRLIGDGTYELQIGMNLLGITEMPVDINKPSDFLLVDGVSAVISRVITDLGINKNWYVVSSVGDPGDEYPVVLGHAYVLIAESAGGLIDFDGDIDVPAAPAANRVGKLNTSWGSIKVK